MCLNRTPSSPRHIVKCTQRLRLEDLNCKVNIITRYQGLSRYIYPGAVQWSWPACPLTLRLVSGFKCGEDCTLAVVVKDTSSHGPGQGGHFFEPLQKCLTCLKYQCQLRVDFLLLLVSTIYLHIFAPFCIYCLITITIQSKIIFSLQNRRWMSLLLSSD